VTDQRTDPHAGSPSSSRARVNYGPKGSALGRGLEVLDAVADSGHARVGELAALLNLPQSTVYRYVRQLRDSGYLHEADGYYSLGPRFQTNRRRESGHLVEVAEPNLRSLCELSGEAAILTVRVGDTALCLDRIMPARRYVLSFRRGSTRPLYAGASATVLLAYAPEDVIARALAAAEAGKDGGAPDPTRLKSRLAATRERGFAITKGEVDQDMVAVAAPAFRGDTCVAGISIAGPVTRFGDERVDALVVEVLRAAEALSDSLGSVTGANAWIMDREIP
jgi:IclR family transcriptional regulator, acetate operon repressor